MNYVSTRGSTPEQAFAPIQRIGGETGWYAYDWLWNLRGFLDLNLVDILFLAACLKNLIVLFIKNIGKK